MCGNTNRPTFGGTIAVLFPQDPPSDSSSEKSLSSSPDSISSTSSTSSLFFRDPVSTNDKTRAVFRFDNADTYHNLRSCGYLDMRIEKYGNLSETVNTPPLHQFKLDLTQKKYVLDHRQMEMEFELPARLDLGVSENGVVGRQVTVSEAGGVILGVGIVGYN